MAKFEIKVKVKQKVVKADSLDDLVDDFVYHPWRYLDFHVRDISSSLFPLEVSFQFDNRIRIRRDHGELLFTGSPEQCAKAYDAVLDAFNRRD